MMFLRNNNVITLPRARQPSKQLFPQQLLPVLLESVYLRQRDSLQRFFKKGDHRGIIAKTEDKTERILDRIDAVPRAEDMNIPGYKFHLLSGNRKGTYAVTMTENPRITIGFDGEDAVDVDLEDYH